MALYLTPWRRSLCAAVIGLLVAAQATVAQLPDFGGFKRSVPGEGETASVEAQFTPAAEGRPALLFVTARIAPGYHMFAVDQGQDADGGGPLPTTLSLAEGAQATLLGPFQPLERPAVSIDDTVWKGLELREHVDRVTWVAPVELAAGVDPASLTIEGLLDGQACNPRVCVPLELPFAAKVGKGVPLPPGFAIEASAVASMASPPNEDPRAASATTAPPNMAAVPSSAVPGPAVPGPATPGSAAAVSASPIDPTRGQYDLSKIELQRTEDGSLIYYLITAFLGGLILNVMPCVLPVIGLKVMSFVQQSGESRGRALLLNVWYSAGIISVFLLLAALAVSLQVGWGDQFGNSWFLISLTAVVFAMALSMLGLWEIPIPGFVSSGAVMDAAHREGAPAAFLKGVLTTILATPCTGPYMVSGVAWAVEQPPTVTFSVFAALGLGMASPYLIIGAFPSLIRFLPRPGAWMETFKKAMGMLLLGTVVWLLSALDAPLLVPTFALLVGITAACWWVAKTPLTDPLTARLRAWGEAIALTAVVAIACYGLLYPNVMLPRHQAQLDAYADKRLATSQMQIAQQLGGVKDGAELQRVVADLVASSAVDGDKPWQDFTLAKLGRLAIDERRTVLVDFTADWCASCKFFEQTVLKTDDVTQALDGAGVATMSADYTKKPGWLRETIRALGGIGVPVLAIFPADRPYEPIVFTGGYTKSGLLEAIAQATGRAGTKTASRAGVAAASER